MSADLYTKAALTVLALLLGANLYQNSLILEQQKTISYSVSRIPDSRYSNSTIQKVAICDVRGEACADVQTTSEYNSILRQMIESRGIRVLGTVRAERP